MLEHQRVLLHLAALSVAADLVEEEDAIGEAIDAEVMAMTHEERLAYLLEGAPESSLMAPSMDGSALAEAWRSASDAASSMVLVSHASHLSRVSTDAEESPPLSARLVEIWKGLVDLLDPLPMIADGVLADAGPRVVTYFGAEVAVGHILSDPLLDRGLGWVTGKLRLMCARSNDGHIQSIRASVGKRDGFQGAGRKLIITLRDQEKRSALITLSPNRSSATVPTALQGDLNELELSLFTSG